MQLNNRYMRKISRLIKFTFCIAFALFGYVNSQAQNHSEELETLRKAILGNLVQFAQNTERNNYSIITLMKVELNKRGAISNITYSDNLDASDKIAFQSEMEKLDKKLLQNFLNKKKIRSIDVLIPIVVYVLKKDKSEVYRINFQDFGKFNNTSFTGKAYWMEPIILEVVIDH